MSQEVPRLNLEKFETSRITDQVEGLLYGDYPALFLPKLPRTKRSPQGTPDTIAIDIALNKLGFICVEGRQGSRETIHSDEDWHVDAAIEDERKFFYPNTELMSLRRHIAVRGIAQAAFRTTLFAPNDLTGYKHDPKAITYETQQSPGDIFYFVSLGGISNGLQIPQAEHKFQTVGSITRRIQVLDFDFTPQ